MEIEVNEYVRTVQGTIAKIEDLEFDIKVKIITGLPMYRKATKTNINTDSVKFEVIKKHSHNPIDLIEEGDYVNDKRVIYVASIEKEDKEELCVFVEETQDCIEAQDIKSIVTKEQFKSIKYEV